MDWTDYNFIASFPTPNKFGVSQCITQIHDSVLPQIGIDAQSISLEYAE